MKTPSLFASGSKAVRVLMIAAVTTPLFFFACNKNSTNSSAVTVTSDDAAEIMTDAVNPTSGGLVLQTSATVTITLGNVNPLLCGVKKDTTITNTYSSNGYSYSYNYGWSRLLTCNNGVPSSYQHTFTGSTSYSTPRLSSDDASQGTFTITGLEPANAQLTINQSYSRTGTQQSKVNQQRSFTSKTNIQTTNVVVSKTTRQIISGTGTISVSGTGSGGSSFSYTGTITFNGSNKATITVNGGGTYVVQW